MRIDPSKPHEIIYSLSNEEGMGYLIYGYAIQLGDNGKHTLQYQRVNPQNIRDFKDFDTEQNRQVLREIEEYGPTEITKRFSKKNEKPTEFLKKFLTEENLEKIILPYCQLRLANILDLLKGTTIYLKNRDNPVDTALFVEPTAAQIEFNFERNEQGTRYFPNIFHKNTYINLKPCEYRVLVNDGAWLRVGSQIYHFNELIEGKRLAPFFEKEFIQVPKSAEKTYYQKFVKLIAEQYPVVFKGVDALTTHDTPQFVFYISEKSPNKIYIKVKYGDALIEIDSKKPRVIGIKTKDNDFVAVSHERNREFENSLIQLITKLGFQYKKNARYEYTGPEQLINVLGKNKDELDEFQVNIVLLDFEKEIEICKPQISFSFKDSSDWFDVKAMIRFGEFDVPFFKLRKNILDKDPYYKLPNGRYALIPEEWFAEYRYLFAFAEKTEDGLHIRKQFGNLLNESNKIELPEIEHGEQGNLHQLGEPLNSIMRSYQKEGFNWLVSLHESGFSGVLADDMGLGKTLQTIALLDSVSKEDNSAPQTQIDLFSYSAHELKPSLVVVPSSLVFNWAAELRKFAPSLKFLIHYGSNRISDLILLKRHHVIITTYGLLRNDFEFFNKLEWNYLILDESQVIKNPTAKITKKVGQLKSKHKLALTGTPIENSLTDLWSQMNFLNKGLLGSYTFFKSEFVTPIEKNANEEQKTKLKKLVYPFILRRTKEQVATELPPLTEQTLYCEMHEDQKKLYDKVKSQYRNVIMDNHLDGPKNRFIILKGLTELRLIANNPKMYDNTLDIGSGKFDEITERLQEVHEAHHKILIFSQFTRHLQIFNNYLTAHKIRFSQLTGATTNRQQVIEQFTNQADCNVFLISLKAGGVGLNLTKADYVFMLDPWWNPFAEKQAIDRAYRIGQRNNVFSYKFITKDTIEEKIINLQQRKKQLAGDFIPVGTKAGFDFDEGDLKELFS